MSDEKWKLKYEFLTDCVVPRSTKKFNYESKDGMCLYRIVTFRQTAEDLIKAAKRELKINIRHF